MVLIQILLFTLLVVSAVNFWFSIIKLSKNKIESGSSEYYSLRLRIDALIVGITIAIGAATFLGIDTAENVEKNLEDGLAKSRNAIDSQIVEMTKIEERVKLIEDKIGTSSAALDDLWNSVNSSKDGIDGFFNKLNQKLAPLESQVEALKQNITKTNIYAVSTLAVPKGDINMTFAFESLKTIDGSSLPKFQHAPLVLVWNDHEFEGVKKPFQMADQITTTGFTLYNPQRNSISPHDLIIIYPIKPLN